MHLQNIIKSRADETDTLKSVSQKLCPIPQNILTNQTYSTSQIRFTLIENIHTYNNIIYMTYNIQTLIHLNNNMKLHVKPHLWVNKHYVIYLQFTFLFTLSLFNKKEIKLQNSKLWGNTPKKKKKLIKMSLPLSKNLINDTL